MAICNLPILQIVAMDFVLKTRVRTVRIASRTAAPASP